MVGFGICLIVQLVRFHCGSEKGYRRKNILTGVTGGMGLRQETVGKEQVLGKILRVEFRYVKFEVLVDIQVMSSGQ